MASELDFDPFCLRYLVDGVEGPCGIPRLVRGFVAELTIRPLDVHVQSCRGTPLTVRAKLDSLGGVQRSESGVEALL